MTNKSLIGMTDVNNVSFLKGYKENWSAKNEKENLEKAKKYAQRQQYQEEAEAQEQFQQKLPWAK